MAGPTLEEMQAADKAFQDMAHADKVFEAKKDLAQAPKWLYGAAGLIPGFAESVRSMGSQFAMRTKGTVQRAAGGLLGDADEAHRWAQAYEEAANEMTTDWLKTPARMARNLGGSLLQAGTVARLGGPYAAIAAGSATEGSEAITDARDAGLGNAEAYQHAAKQAAYEGLFALLFQRLSKHAPGLGGTESALAGIAGKATARGVATGMAGEALEEGLTAFAQQAQSGASGVNPAAFTPEQLIPAVGEAAFLGALGSGIASTPDVMATVIRNQERARRLENLRSIRAKGYVSADEGQAAGIPGDTRKERLESIDEEITQLTQEIENASAVRSPEAEVQQQEQGGADIRGERQVEVPAEPAGEVAPAPEVLAKPEDDLASLMAAAEAAAPEQPKRDVAAEIGEALKSGPVTVTTPQVQSGFKVAKVREDGKVVTKKGRVLTPDETWVIKPAEPAVEKPPVTQEQARPVVEQPEVAQTQPKGPFVVEWGTRARGRDSSDVETYEEAVGLSDEKWKENVDFVTIYDADGNEIEPQEQEKPEPVVEPEAVPVPVEQPKKKRGRKDQPVAEPRPAKPNDNFIWDDKANGWRMKTAEEGFKPTQPEPPPQAEEVKPGTVKSDKEIANDIYELSKGNPDVDPDSPIGKAPTSLPRGRVVSKRGQTAIPGFEEAAAEAEERTAEQARWGRYVDDLVARNIGVTEDAANSMMSGFTAKVKKLLTEDSDQNSLGIAELIAEDLELKRSGSSKTDDKRRDTAIEMIEPAVAEAMTDVAKTLKEAHGWKVGQNVETRYPQMFGKITGFEVEDGGLQARVQPADGTDSAAVEFSDIMGEYDPVLEAELDAKDAAEKEAEAKPEPTPEPPAKKQPPPASLTELPPPLTVHRGPTTAADKAFWEDARDKAAKKRAAIEDSKTPLQKELSKTRRNAHKKRGNLQDQIREKDRALSVADKEHRAAQNKLSYARLEAIIDNPPTPEHAWAAHGRLNDLLADEARERGDYKERDKFQTTYEQATKKLLPFAEAAVREAGLVDDKDVERAAHTAASRFQSSPEQYKSIAEAAPFGIEAVRRERMMGGNFAELDRARQQTGPYQTKTTPFSALSAKDLDELTTKLQAAVKDDANWREKTAALFTAAKEKSAALEQKANEERAAKAEEARIENEKRAAELAKEQRERAKGVSQEAMYWKSVKSRASSLKGNKTTATLSLKKTSSSDAEEVDVPIEMLSKKWGIAEIPTWSEKQNKWVKPKLAGETPKFSLTFIETGDALGVASNAKKIKELWIHGLDAGLDWDAAHVDMPKETGFKFRAVERAWRSEELHQYSDEAIRPKVLATLPESKPLPFEADVTLGAMDLGYGSNREAEFVSSGRLKEFAASVPEFRYRPIFTVDSKKNLVFRDGYKFTFPATSFGMEAGELTPGQTVAINLPELGIQLASEQDVVAEMLKNHGFVNVQKPKAGTVVTASWKGKKVEVDRHGEEQWSPRPGTGGAVPAKQVLDRIRWVNPGTADEGPSKGRTGPSLTQGEPMQINEASLTQRSPAPTGLPSWKEDLLPEVARLAAVPEVAAEVKKIKERPKEQHYSSWSGKHYEVESPIEWKPLYEAIGNAGYKGRDLQVIASELITPSEKPKKTKKTKQAADQSVPENQGPVSESRMENEYWKEFFDKAKVGEYFFARKKNPEPNSYSAAGIYYKVSPTEAVVIEGENYLTDPKKEVAAYNKTGLQKAADKATQEAFDEAARFGKLLKKKGSQPTAMLDPEIAAGASRVVAKFVKAGTLKFAAMVEQLAARIGQAAVDRIRPHLEAEWDRLAKSDSSMEPRTPENQAEPPPVSDDDLTSIKKEIVNELREMVGLPEMEGSTAQTVEEWVDTAKRALAADPKAAIRLVNELATDPRPISQHDAMLLQFRYRQLANALQPVVDDYFAAVQSKDPVAIATAKTALVNARKAMTDFEEIIHPSKETWGRTGVALQQMLKRDMSVEAVLRRGQEANDGEELSLDQTAELTDKAKRFQELQAQFEEQRKKSEALEAELASKRQHEEAVNKAKRERVQKKSDKRAEAEKKVADAWEKFRQAMATTAPSGPALAGHALEIAKAYVELGYVRLSEFMAAVRQNVEHPNEQIFKRAWEQATGDAGVEVEGLDPADRAGLSKVAREIQRELVEAGMTERDEVIDAVHEALQVEIPDLTRRQTMDALSRYGQFQRQSQDEIEKIIRGMNSEILKLSQIDQMEIAMRRVEELRAQGRSDDEIGRAIQSEKLLVEATGLVRDRPSQTVRQLTQKYNELKKAIPATPEGKAGLLQTTLAQIERGLRNRIDDLKFEIARKEKVVKEKRDRPTNDLIKSLETERDALVKIHKEMFPPKKPSEAQRIAMAIRGAEKAIAAIEQQLATQDFDRERKTPLSSPELDARRARLEQLRAARKAALAMEKERMEGEGGRTKAQTSSAEIARRSYEASLRTRIADYMRVLAEGDFSPKPKKGPRALAPSEMKLKRQMEDVRHEVLQKYADYHLAHLKGIAWGADKVAEAAHLSRALMTSFDLSALGRQGGLAAAGHPVLAKNALVETVASIAHTFDPKAIGKDFSLKDAEKFLTGIDSRQAEFDFMHKLTSGPAGELRQQAGLSLPSTDQAITRQEEAFQGRWGKHVPGIALSSRLYTMILNKLRADLFDSMVQNLGRNGQVTMDEAKVIASFVNVSTGRSDLKMFNNAAAALNTVFFAPRYVASRFQYLAMPFYLPFQGGLKQNWRVKQAIYKEYGRTATGLGTVLGAFALLGGLLFDDDDEDKPTVELDPRSPDFLKVRIGETRLDFMAGLSQVTVLSSRLGLGQTKSSVTGKVRDFGEGYNPPTRLGTLLHFGRTKLAPVPGAIATIADDWTNVIGQPETPLSMAGGLVTPLSLKDVAKTMEAQGIPAGTAMSLLSILGIGMNTYGPKTQYMTGTPEERQAQIAEDLKKMTWDSPERPPYSEFLTDEQLADFERRREEKRGLVIYNATYHGKDEEELKTRDKNREYLKEMAIPIEEADRLLRGYYLRRHDGKLGKLTEGYGPRKLELKRIYAE